MQGYSPMQSTINLEFGYSLIQHPYFYFIANDVDSLFPYKCHTTQVVSDKPHATELVIIALPPSLIFLK